jgi:hypothetical protein
MLVREATIKELKLYVGRMLVLVAAVLIVGCNFHSGSPVAHLKGKVTIAGKPVPSEADARIIFAPPATGSNRNAKPAIVPIVNSQYDAPEVPVGPMTARFDIQRNTGREFARGMKESENLVPKEDESGFALDVTEGAQTHDFDL